MGKSAPDAKDRIRHNPLHKDITSSGGRLREQPRGAKRAARELPEEGYLDAATSRKILQLAKEQQEEMDREEMVVEESAAPVFAASAALDDQDDSDSEEYSDLEGEFYEEEEIAVDEKDQELFDKYFGTGAPTVNLADKILAKIQEKELSKGPHQPASEQQQNAVKLPPKVIAAYEKIGSILATYKHGKLPKLFKVLPTLKNWEDVLYVTNPQSWSSHATYEATKLFVSNLQANQAQKFVENVLLEKFRVSIEDSETHSLDYHLYRAIKKSLYKPGAFFKGFLLPLVDGHCTVREATIVASVLAKVSVPVLHSSVALAQLVQREFRPASTVFIRVLIEKKYALPYQTLDELVFYFMRFRNAAQAEMSDGNDASMTDLPVVWHKAFLAFAQRYKNDITDDQRDFLLETVRQRFHHAIGPEIRRELLSGVPRMDAPQAKEATMEEAF
ncbi:Bystin-domain-containing protein [Metschnikowia bicuspidata var. bicuspidata NRRL YB-4993]|uniref:Bystin-domain-containing protein n=1 Tax=Metschnikowia bicuspidata var. bicuspidata NRRL YB-4993 TaxID=869754 RepID=A0A1A0H9L1_9ASCO|nr:Bystin-domain-containing protein [Metschnikowia bicuspidata var. bicuspidata NRRL YB-4993]OBA20814.1 Bystin-domain-containing protein [Metschnikowia bicuspidata var. bicuspidata NRRL YB-4993]